MLVHFEAQGFRNLDDINLDFECGSHLIVGGNGAGKTSILEAIYLLSTTRSFRTSRISDCCRHGTSSFALSGEVETDRRVRLSAKWNQGQRLRSLNGRKSTLSEFLSSLPVISWSAAESQVLVGLPSARRRFMDRGILGIRPSGLSIFSRYRQVLHEKKKLLQSGGSELAVWNELFASAAWELIRLRLNFVNRLRCEVNSILDSFDLGLGDIELDYRCSPSSGLEGPEAILAELTAASTRERVQKQALLGPHRDDLRIQWDGYSLRSVASAGERKVLGLVFQAALGRVIAATGREAIYLLDDADTELDADRLASVWRVFQGARQLLLTSNRRRVWEGCLVNQIWLCNRGVLTPA